MFESRSCGAVCTRNRRGCFNLTRERASGKIPTEFATRNPYLPYYTNVIIKTLLYAETLSWSPLLIVSARYQGWSTGGVLGRHREIIRRQVNHHVCKQHRADRTTVNSKPECVPGRRFFYFLTVRFDENPYLSDGNLKCFITRVQSITKLFTVPFQITATKTVYDFNSCKTDFAILKK